MTDYAGKKVLIIGLARTGLSTACLLDRLGAETTVTDTKTESELGIYVEKLPEKTVKKLGGHGGVDVSDYDLAVISPGVPWDSQLPVALRDAGVELISEIELASRLLSAPVIAVTGSNGKSTTTTLMGRMLEEAGLKVYTGGNIGAPLADAVGEDYDWIVAEVSSFQLEGVKTFRPKIALILNITPDHIDRHKTMTAYAALKNRIYENQREGDTLIINAADPMLEDVAPPRGVKVLRFGFSHTERDGVYMDGQRAVAFLNGETEKLFSAEDLAIQGRHNQENALAAALAAYMAGVTSDDIRKAILSFKGLPHRMERVAEIDGVFFVNDSKGTNPDATVMSLAGFEKNVILIAGGSSKGADFSSLAEAVWKSAKGVVLIGGTAEAIEEALGVFQPKVHASSMEEAVRMASAWAARGDTVLLSPACASFDMFENYEDRGEAFKRAVGELVKEGGRCR